MNMQPKSIPPLAELVRMDSQNALIDFAPDLSFSEILIVAAKPLHDKARPDKEIALFHDISTQKLAALERERTNVLHDISDRFRLSRMQEVAVSDYLAKYSFLVSESAVPKELEERLTPEIRRDLENLRGAIQEYTQGNGNGKYSRELGQYSNARINLRYLFQNAYGKQPIQLVSIKTKADWRTAGKIPYNMIKGYRDRIPVAGGPKKKKKSPRKINDIVFRRHIRLEDGKTRDNVGLQFVVLDDDIMGSLKEYIARSRQIEVLPNQEGELFEVYGGDGPYSAMHVSVAWNPNRKNRFSFNPHIEGVELMVMMYPSFISANFGQDSYWQRMMLQQTGIVKKRFDEHGFRKVDRFTGAELNWKKEVERRILLTLNYGLPQANAYR